MTEIAKHISWNCQITIIGFS